MVGCRFFLSLCSYPALLDVFQDISLSQWLALTPPELVKAHLGFSDDVIDHLSKVKQVIVR
jgi:oxalate decarboxylase/phosphoglucose isomerase-like protein (cupin superfamily)